MGNKQHTLPPAGLRPQRAELNTKPLRLTCRSCDLKTFPAARLTVNVFTSGRAGTPSLCCLVDVIQEIYHLRKGGDVFAFNTNTDVCCPCWTHRCVEKLLYSLFQCGAAGVTHSHPSR